MNGDCPTDMVKDLVSAKENRKMMAVLRRSLSPTLEHKAFPYLIRWVNITNERDRTVAMCVAGCFALHKEHSDSAGSLGASLKQLAKSRHTRNPEEAFSKRFLKIVGGERDAACKHVSLAIRSLKGVPVNYELLLKDLWYWNDRVRRTWAQEYWG